ncbi:MULTISPECIES: hypothetical protein [Pseudoalteromonas]|jgi:hypothetical protein|uniref:Uncharacterized protein n=2 Tax=Pseudoalteromonas aliena TaxID=247523 RepID=A0A1Q2GTV7_9GAMM|nr:MULTISPECIES: hypothetical protein [Pseudoalteromonas]AQP98545.1 hypothetical protein B0W48_01285 [Pseudoalteromonas aliena]MBB1386801.1 hypothetical protein [Pseudoalteromonas sp. SG45-5]MBB1394870.1 hypothetical protein [Pseudoalteromonas sp. SG44-4]MBB1446998.1 hypothetical protein [Pseudoalteromonas sp. SG41-6]MBE0361763.1 hypothetical protein [Pseudoalteromonas aliena SW19]
MTLPIGSGFFTGDIPGRVSSTQVVTNKPQSLVEQPATQKANTDYVKSSKKGEELANQLFKSSAKSNEYSQTIYDQPSAQVSKAISTYTEFANLERRAEVQNLIGVDIYA